MDQRYQSSSMFLKGDPFKTLFVARVSFEATERKLRREFEEYGPIKNIRLVHEKNNGADHLQQNQTVNQDNACRT